MREKIDEQTIDVHYNFVTLMTVLMVLGGNIAPIVYFGGSSVAPLGCNDEAGCYGTKNQFEKKCCFRRHNAVNI
jgi:hypothetical protein